ncbi:MAG: HTH domain-containing protein [Bacteroidota bacterium]
MSKKFIEAVKKLDHLIHMERTGSAQDLARKMRVSTRCIYNYIGIMRNTGAPIVYNRKKKTFVYLQDGVFHFGFVKVTEIDLDENKSSSLPYAFPSRDPFLSS